MLNTKIVLTVFSLALASFTLSACETIDGAGRDLEKAGEAVQDAAN